ncbi:MAG: molybdate ABC transporter substrate-binding protein [Phaeovulum sp.]|uniref:molybdate ABC transporter substrate-binding protein n=1 Tax=Phaeovulum sp. TaxID=2934796 RepID=UPI0027376BF0|nr:molybdate ABC transporter substrate-binding protein [Phaeovulum sp.]MDP3860386.1 molybdate ABC transporter substrate-binding protein [Phaeovulum sp.]
MLDQTRRGMAAFGLALMSGLAPVSAMAEDRPVIAAAADLKFALTEIAAAFAAETGTKVDLAFGSTGNFATQIREGAPYQMYMAADESYVAWLAAAGLTRDEGTLYAQGRIVMMVPHGSRLAADGSLETLRAALAAGNISHFAIANPEHAPYGRRAMEALRHQGIWEALGPFLVLGENVSQAAQFATSGDAEGGIIAYSLAMSEQVSRLGSYQLIPADWHAPLNQRMVLLKSAGPVAEAFYVYIGTPAAREIMKKYGFGLPGE